MDALHESAIVQPLPLPKHRRVLVVSDIHGNLHFLKGLLNRAGFCKEDILIILGDILEKSIHGLDTLHYLMDLQKQHTVYFVRGNCENVPLGFLDGSWPEEVCLRYSGLWKEKCSWIQMARLAGVPITSPKDYPAAREAIERTFAEELAFLRAMPTILETEDSIFVHGGIRPDVPMESMTCHACTKYDDFLHQGHHFSKWVIVGHWPVTLYRTDYTSMKPLFLPHRRIISLDGGCMLETTGQLNALILPRSPDEGFSYYYYDDFPEAIAETAQSPSPAPVNIRWGHHGIEILERKGEFCRCRHLESGRELDILTDMIYDTPKGVFCDDTTDYELPIQPGDRLGIVRETSRGYLVKKHGDVGWYRGKLHKIPPNTGKREAIPLDTAFEL